MNQTRWERWGAASGFGALALSAAAMVFERGPLTPDQSREAVVAHLTANGSAMLTQAMLFLAGAAVYLWFIGSLRTFLARAESGTGRVSTVAFGAGVTWIGVNVVAQAFAVGLAMAPAAGAPPALISTMNAMFTIAALPLGVMLIAVAVVSLRHRAFPAWIGWLAVAAAVSQFVLWYGTVVHTGPLAADGWLSYALYFVFLAWFIPAIVAMVRNPGRPPASTHEDAVRLPEATQRMAG
jgi:hypothetical protein